MGDHQSSSESHGPTVRLGLPLSSPNNSLAKKADRTFAPTVRLSCVGEAQGEKNGALLHPSSIHSTRPALLVSYVYLEPFLKNKHRYDYRDWVLDSGAFSAHNTGKEIRLADYIETCKRLMETDPTLSEIYSLDVIGNWVDSLKNTEAMWRAGVPAIPCYHVNEPEHVLRSLAADYPKIALGGVALVRNRKRKMDWAKQCFARVWPKKVHGFAFCSEEAVMTIPFHSVDASSWEMAPCGFGNWKSFGKMSWRGSTQNLRAEVDWYLRLEARARDRWKREMALLEAEGEPNGRLALSGGHSADKRYAMGDESARSNPIVRLAVTNPETPSNRQLSAFGKDGEG